MTRLDIAGDARRTLDAIRRGGIAIVPNDTGYACCGSSMDPLKKIYDTKRAAATSAMRWPPIWDPARTPHPARRARSRWSRRSWWTTTCRSA